MSTKKEVLSHAPRCQGDHFRRIQNINIPSLPRICFLVRFFPAVTSSDYRGEKAHDLCLALRVILEEESAGDWATDPTLPYHRLPPRPGTGPFQPLCAWEPGSLGACPPGLWRSTARGQELLLTWLSPHRAPAAPQLVDGNLAWSVQIFLFCDSFWISDCLFLILSRNLDFPLQLPIPAPREEANSMEQQVKVAGTNYRMACTNDGGATLG